MTIRYLNILLACAGEPWAMERTKLETVTRFLLRASSGGTVSAEEMARITQQRQREIARADGDIAVIPVFGVLAPRMNLIDEISGGTSTLELANNFRTAIADQAVKAIVLNIDSPGGTVSGTQELADEIFDSRGVKPIIAQVNFLAASAAYWIASAADEVVVPPSGRAGSIGVYTIHEDISQYLENEGIKETIIRAGENKILDNPFEPLSEKAAAQLKAEVDGANAAFVRAVARNRNTSMATVNDRFGQGLMFRGQDLVDRGMADRLGELTDTLERFGMAVRPAVAAARAERTARADAGNVLITKLRAGDRPSLREWEHGLKGLAGLSNSEAERAVRLCLKEIAQGEPENPTEPAISARDVADLRRGLADIRQLLTP